MTDTRVSVLPFALIASMLLLCYKPAAAQVRRDAQAIHLLSQSVAALSAGKLTDASLTADVQYSAGAESTTGTGTLKAKGSLESSSTLPVQANSRTEVRQNYQGTWSAGSQPQAIAYHNCLNTAAWFIPDFLLIDALSNHTREVVYVGAESMNGSQVHHLSVAGVTGNPDSFVTNLSQTEIYLDAATLKPVSITFNLHPDLNALPDLPVVILFDNYQAVDGIQIPFHVRRLLQSTLMLDIVVTQAAVNSGLSDSDFAL